MSLIKIHFCVFSPSNYPICYWKLLLSCFAIIMTGLLCRCSRWNASKPIKYNLCLISCRDFTDGLGNNLQFQIFFTFKKQSAHTIQQAREQGKLGCTYLLSTMYSYETVCWVKYRQCDLKICKNRVCNDIEYLNILTTLFFSICRIW